MNNLSYSESKDYLDPLRNICTYHRTKEFLWEFCYKKYFK